MRRLMSGFVNKLFLFFIILMIASMFCFIPFSFASFFGFKRSYQWMLNKLNTFNINGYFLSTYSFKSYETSKLYGYSTDNDISGELRLEIEVPGKYQPCFYFLGDFKKDIDGEQDREGYYPLEDIYDTYPYGIRGIVYEAYLEIKDIVEGVRFVRVGRQIYRGFTISIYDGINSELYIGNSIAMRIFGGAVVHPYEVDYSWGDDLLSGLSLNMHIFEPTFLELRYTGIKNRDRVNDISRYSHNYLLNWRQKITKNIKCAFSLDLVNDKMREVNTGIYYVSYRLGMEAIINGKFLLESKGVYVPEDGGFSFMGDESPYGMLSFRIRKSVKNLWVSAGAVKKAIFDGFEENSFNRNYLQCFLGFDFYDLIYSGLYLGVTFDFWQVYRNYNLSLSVNFGYSEKGANGIRVETGSYFGGYEYIPLGQEEDMNLKSRVYYIRVVKNFHKVGALSSEYRYEGGVEKFHAWKVSFRYDI